MRKYLGTTLAMLLCTAAGQAQTDVHALAAKVDAHYNHLSSFRTTFIEHYSGMGLQRTESGTLLLRKPGRMRWSYTGGKLFVLDGKYAVSYVPGEPQAQRVPAKQLDDMRSPLRFLLGNTRLEKELDGLQASPGPGGTLVLAGTPHYSMGPGEQRVQGIAIRVLPATGSITGLQIHEIDGTVTDFDFSDTQENVPAADAEFRFTPPAGVVVVNGMPPA
ncbi:MAG: LolA family protein [Janthinobacterium lividum]